MPDAGRTGRDSVAIPTRVGIGLRAPHCREIIESRPDIGWVEVHSENYFGDGGQPHRFLERIRADYPLSLHGVGLGLGSAASLDLDHLRKLARLIRRYDPGLVSEHLCWSRTAGRHLNDLLPLPYTEEALTHICARIDETQETLSHQLLIENVSSYLRFRHSTIPEWEFLIEVARRSGCGILLDVNNVYVNAVNHGFDPLTYLAAVPAEAVREIHLAGFDDGGPCLIDTHGAPVANEVWSLYRETIARLGPRPTLIEWDTDIPPLAVLLGEAGKATQVLEGADAVAA
ncbi:MAG TPA: DUF692 domain-containing protein [Burkholderiales bacterium]|nr:DUF692 domain-containing protein [Burkholderiales bacterium]